MQAVSLLPAAPASPAGPVPAAPPRGGAAFDRVMQDADAAAPDTATEPVAAEPAELAEGALDAPDQPEVALDPDAPELVLPALPQPAEPPVPAALSAILVLAQGIQGPDAEAPLADIGVPAQVASTPILPSARGAGSQPPAPLSGPAPAPTTQGMPQPPAPAGVNTVAAAPVAFTPAPDGPAPVQQAMGSPDRITAAALSGSLAALPMVAAKSQQREAVVPGFWTLRTRDLPGDPLAVAPPVPPAAPAAATPLALPGPALLPLTTDSDPVIDLLPAPDVEMPHHAPTTQSQVTAGASPPAAAGGLPPTLATDLSALLARRPDGPVELTLSPEELGRLRISLTQDGDGLIVTVQVERAETLDLLRRNADLLLQEVRAAGFAGGSFSFSGWGGAASGGAASQALAPQSEAPPPPPPQLAPIGAGLDLRL